MEKIFIVASGLSGALAVGLGAFGAHGLTGLLANAEDAAKRLDWWQTASHYHLMHALALGLAAWLCSRGDVALGKWAGFSFLAGTVIFSGTLYAMSLGAPRVLGAITPIGGLLLIVGWLLFMWAGLAR